MKKSECLKFAILTIVDNCDASEEVFETLNVLFDSYSLEHFTEKEDEKEGEQK